MAAQNQDPRPNQRLGGNGRQLWTLFMTEFWERFAFYGMRWAITLYIVQEFFGRDPSGEGPASRIYAAYLALVYATGVFGGWVADRLIGHQRAILLGAAIAAVGASSLIVPNRDVFLAGLAVVLVGSGLCRPNISAMVGKIYAPEDPRRDRGFTIFYMAICAAALTAPLATGLLAGAITATPMTQNYKIVFIASGVSMIVSLLWFWFGRRRLSDLGGPTEGENDARRLAPALICAAIAVPILYLLLARADVGPLQWMQGGLFIAMAIMLFIEALRQDGAQRNKAMALLSLFAVNLLFFLLIERTGSSLSFLAENIVNRDLGGFVFPAGWFPLVGAASLALLAPIILGLWAWLGSAKTEPSSSAKFGLGLMANALGLLALAYALENLVVDGQIPLWPLMLCYALQTIGELCLAPIGLSLVSQLAPVRHLGLAMGGWFLSGAVGVNLSGAFAGEASAGATAASALSGFTWAFYGLLAAGSALFLGSRLIKRATGA